MGNPDDGLSKISYSRMHWNSPLSLAHADLLLQRLADGAPSTLLDLGCGWGELLIHALAHGPGESWAHTQGTGVDIDTDALERAQQRAEACQLGARATFVAAEAADWVQPADRVICIGASHAWGGTKDALHGLLKLVLPGGRLLFGDGCWEKSPTAAAAAMFGDETLTLEDLVAHATALGWRVLHLSTADQREWDDFESTWRSARQEWLLHNGGHPQAAEVREKLDMQLKEYVADYRGVLAFCYLVLGRATT